MKKFSIIVFFLIYGLFYVFSVLFFIDCIWYDVLEKLFWIFFGMIIGMIWVVLFGFIVLLVVIIYNNYGFKLKIFWFLFFLNYIFN